MYVNPLHRLTDRQTLFALMASHPLGAWVCHGRSGLVANHVPFLLDPSRGPFGTLIGHVSRANTVWRELGADVPSVVMFQGPQAYITPGWYPGKAEHGEVVPTWNYVVVHAHGVAMVVDDRDRLFDMLRRLTEAHEAPRPAPWSPSDAPAPFMERMMRAIVGIEIPIDRLEGKLKASQDEAMPDRQGTVRGLREQACDTARAMAALVQGAIDAEAADSP
jgi:transcriptional regulator